MTDLAKLVVRLEAQTTKYQKDLEKANDKLGRFEKNTKKSISGIKTAFGALALGAFTKKIIDSTIAQERAVKQLEQGLSTTGNAVGLSLQQLTKHAEDLQKATTFGDEDIIAAQSKLVTFTRITGDEFKRTTELALDLSTRMGTDVTSASIQLGKALNDPVKNLSALSRAGIQFTDNQKGVIKALFEGGRQAEAQQVILAELETQFGGSAKAARDTFGGALKSVGNSFGDLLEAKGGLSDAQAALEEFNSLLQDPDTIDAANSLGSGIIKVFSQITSSIAGAVNLARTFGENIAAALHGPAIDDLPRILKKLELIEGQRLAILNIPENDRQTGHVYNLKQLDIEKAKLEGLLETRKLFGASNDPLDPSNTAAFEPADKFTPSGQGGKGGEVAGVTGVPTIDVVDAEFERLKTSLLSQEDAIRQSHKARQLLVYENTESGSEQQRDLLSTLHNQEELQLAEHFARMGGIEEEYQLKALKFSKLTNKEKTKSFLKEATLLTAGASQHSQKMFKLNKTLALANALVNLPEAVSGAYAFGAEIGGPYLGAAFGALAFAAETAQINAIRATSFSGGGGGTTPSSAGSVPVINDIPVSSSAQTTAKDRAEPPTEIHIYGDVIGNDAELLFDSLKSLINDGDHVLIENHSRNGRELTT